jgi:hypothetical protein
VDAAATPIIFTAEAETPTPKLLRDITLQAKPAVAISAAVPLAERSNVCHFPRQ